MESASSQQQLPSMEQTNRMEKDHEEYPEGGRGWVVLIGTFLALVTTYGTVQSFGTYQLLYETEFFPDVQSNRISMIGALQPFIIYVSCVPAVAIINLVGIRWTVIIGFVLMILSMMMMSLSHALWHFYLCQGVLFGFGAGLLFFVAMVIPPEWFKKRRALAAGITASGSSIGGLVWPIATQHLFKEIGFPWATRVLGFIFIPIMAACVFTIKPRILNQKRRVMPNWAVMRSGKFMLFNIGAAISIVGYFPAMFYIATYAAKVQPAINSTVRDNIITIMNSCSILGRTGVSYLADRWGRLNLTSATVLLTGVVQLAFWLPANNTAMVTIFAVAYGIMSATYAALVPSAIGQLFGLKDNDSRLCINFFMVGIGSFIGPIVSGTFLPSDAKGTEGFDHLIAFTATMIIFGSFLMVGLRVWYSRKVVQFV